MVLVFELRECPGFLVNRRGNCTGTDPAPTQAETLS
jgi:hypothetical protein